MQSLTNENQSNNENPDRDYRIAICVRNLFFLLLFVISISVFRPSFKAARPQLNLVVDNPPQSNEEPNVYESGSTMKTDSKRLSGFDVSHYQGVINWSSIDKNIFKFVFIKATQGVSLVDRRYTFNKSQSQKVGITHGAYHYFEPQNNPTLQAQHYLQVTGLKHDLPPVIDIEITGGLAKTAIVKSLKKWLQVVELKTNCKPIIYSNLAYWQEYLASEFAEYPLWVAEYNVQITHPRDLSNWVFWQNSESAQIRGVRRTVDTDFFNLSGGSLESLLCK